MTINVLNVQVRPSSFLSLKEMIADNNQVTTGDDHSSQSSSPKNCIHFKIQNSSFKINVRMFVSADMLAINYGVDDAIAKFFADREPPKDNLYWHGKLLYLRPVPGYLFIPIIVDLLYRLKIPKKDVLGDEYVHLMEAVGHIAASEETGKINHTQVIEEAIALTANNHQNKGYYNALIDYMNGGKENFIARLAVPFKALHRGDVFLFSLCALDIDNDKIQKIIEYWFALISVLLLLDDGEDIAIDKESGDANAFVESGLNKEGLEKIRAFGKEKIELLRTINKPLAATVEKKLLVIDKLPHIKELEN